MTSVPMENYTFPFELSLVFILLAPFAIAGLALINAGLGRSRSAAHAMTSSLCVICVAMLVYFAWGFAVQGYAPSRFWLPPISGTPRGFFLAGLPWGTLASLTVLLGLFSVGLASIIPLGAAADRWRLSAACASTALLAGCTYPLFVRLTSASWIAHAAESGSGGLLDAGGSGAIQVTGGLTALSIAWLLGPRRGKYSPNGMWPPSPHTTVSMSYSDPCWPGLAGSA